MKQTLEEAAREYADDKCQERGVPKKYRLHFDFDRYDIEQGFKAVNARYLHSFLESKQQFSDWIKGRINKYDFVEGKDFETLYFDYQGNLLNIRHHNFMKSENQKVSKIEYALSIGMAKELSMLENNERGKQARKYFIACEENKRELSRKELALMVIQAEEDKERLALENEKKQKQIERLKPKAD